MRLFNVNTDDLLEFTAVRSVSAQLVQLPDPCYSTHIAVCVTVMTKDSKLIDG